MKLYLFPIGRAVRALSLKHYLWINGEMERLDFKQGDQRTSEYVRLSPNKKM